MGESSRSGFSGGASASQAASAFQRDPEAARQHAMEQPLPAARTDVQISPQLYLGETTYLLKDPVSLRYFRLSPAEHYTFRNLDGRTSAKELAEGVARRFRNRRSGPEHVLGFVESMKAAGLLLGRSPDHGQWLRRMNAKRTRSQRIAQWSNFLFIKIPVLDPDRVLDGLYRYAGLLMNRWTMWAAIAFMAVSWAAALFHLQRAGDLAFPLLGATNLALLSVTFFVVKVIHEFGHGLAAKHRGLEVHEMGVMLMVFFPLFYVDTSDAWMVPRRWDRLWINAGGVFIEFLFAAAAAWIWLNTGPGVMNQAAFNIMLAASVTTLLFNANPLLRYDGYYFLMDWLEIPNLKQKARAYVGYLTKRYVLWMSGQLPPAEASTHPIFMPLYAVASTIYRFMIVFGIITLVWHILDPYGLEALGSLMGIVAITTMVLLPMVRTLRFVWSQQARTWRRLAASGGALAALGLILWGLASLPWENTVERPLVAVAEQRRALYAPSSGHVEEVLAEAGQRLEAGEAILRLRDDELEDRRRDLELQRKMARLSIRSARQRGRLGEATEAMSRVEQVDQRIEHVKRKIEELTIRAPFAGRLEPRRRLRSLIGTPLEAGERIGVMIGSGTPRLVLVLPQSDASLVQAHAPAPVRVRLWADPSRTYHGRVRRLGRQFLNRLPHSALSSRYGGEVDSKPTDRYNAKPASPSVVAEIALDPEGGMPAPQDGMTGRGKIIVGRSSLGAQQWRSIRQALSLDWWL